MSVDRREQILARLVEIMKTVPGIDNVYRNQGDISDSARPASRVFDGGESLSDRMLAPQPSRAGGVMTMNAVNSLQFRLPQFNLGGLVDGFSAAMTPRPLLPAFATGGLVSQPRGGGLHPVTLQMPGGQRVGGVFATPDAVESLRRTAMLEQISSTGRKSSTT